VTTDRHELTAAAAGAAVAGALALTASGQTWAQVTHERPAPLPPVSAVLTGADAAPLVPATGLVLLAAAVALFAVRGGGRVLVGLLVSVAGGTLGWSGVRALAGGLSDASTRVPGVGRGPAEVTLDVSGAWPQLAVAAGLLGVAVGVLVVLRGRRWPGMGRRYERSGTGPAVASPVRARTDEERAQTAWQALDRGEDPTEDATEDPAVDPTEEAPSPAGGRRSEPGIS
jgi:uncharacterized membrane protein (TIGR02234 family)